MKTCGTCKNWLGDKSQFRYSIKVSRRSYISGECQVFLSSDLVHISTPRVSDLDVPGTEVETCGEFSCPQWEASK